MIVLKRRRPPETPAQITTGRCIGVAELLTGLLNNSNQVFTTTNNYESGRISVLYNGQALHSPQDFTETGPNEVTFKFIRPFSTDNLRVIYEYDECAAGGQISGKEALIYNTSSHTVAFVTAMPDTDYIVQTNITNVIDAVPAQYPEIVTSKTVNGFTVDFSGDIDSDNYVLEWIVVEL